MQHNFTILSLCQRLNTEEAKLRFYIPPKISKFRSSIKSTLFENIPAPLLHTLAEAIDSATSCLFSVETGFIM